MKQLIINVGPSGCGKTTWTIEFLKTHPDFFRINRDDIRRTLFGEISPNYYSSPDVVKREAKITKAEITLALTLASQSDSKSSFVLDNTNLTPSVLKQWIDYTNSGSPKTIEAKINIFPVPSIEELKTRVSTRDNKNRKELDYIDRQYAQYNNIVNHINEHYKHLIYNE